MSLTSSTHTAHTAAMPSSQAGAATPVQRLRALLRRPAFLGTAVLVVALAVVWGAMLFSASQPQTLDQRAAVVDSQLLLPGGDGESLSNAAGPQADLMRQVVREQLASGRSEQQVIAYMEAHYGEGILAKPPLDGFTLLIWAVPGLMLVLGVGGVVVVAREWRPARVAPVARSVRMVTASAAPADESEKTVEAMSEVERAQWRALLERELAAEEGLPPRTGKPGTREGA